VPLTSNKAASAGRPNNLGAVNQPEGYTRKTSGCEGYVLVRTSPMAQRLNWALAQPSEKHSVCVLTYRNDQVPELLHVKANGLQVRRFEVVLRPVQQGQICIS
jgi:hypothetical protein